MILGVIHFVVVSDRTSGSIYGGIWHLLTFYCYNSDVLSGILSGIYSILTLSLTSLFTSEAAGGEEGESNSDDIKIISLTWQVVNEFDI